MPVKGQNGGPQGLLDVLRDPPITLFIELTNCDSAGSTCYGELLLVG